MSHRPVDPRALPPEQARAYLAAIVESSVDAIKAKTLDGTIVFWNEATERMYGYTAEEAIGRNVSFVIPSERPNELPEILARVARGKRVEHYETERVRKDGTRLDVSISVSPIRDEAGAIVGAATIARDISERKRAERGHRLLATAAGLFAEARLHSAAILDGLCRAAVETVTDVCVVELLGDDGVTLHAAAVHDADPALAELRRQLLAEHPLRVGEGFAGQIVGTDEPLLVPVVESDLLRPGLVPGRRAHLERLRLRSLLGVPMRAYGRTLGALILGRRHPDRPYADQDVGIIQELADRAAMALDAAWVHADAERARREAEHLAAITRQLGRSLALGDVLDRVADAASELLGSPVAGVFLLDAAGDGFDLAAGRGLDAAPSGRLRLPRHGSVAGRAAAAAGTIIVEDAGQESAVLPALVSGEPIGSLVVAPIGRPGAPVGVVEVYATRPHAFTARDAELLTALADAAAVAVANARLHQDLRDQATAHIQLNAELRRLADERDAARAAAERALARTEFLARASAELGGSLGYETTLSTVAHLAVPAFADWCAVDLVDETGAIRRLAVAHVDPARVAVAQEIARRYPTRPDAPTGVPAVVRTGRSELYPDISDEMLVAGAVDAEHLALARALGLRSAIVAPMTARGRVLGALSLVWAESGHGYDAADLAVAEDLAQRGATAVDNARLYRAAGAARAEAEAERDRLRQVVEELPEGVVVMDARGRVAVSNPAARATLGVDPRGRSLPTGPATTRRVRQPDGAPVAPADLPIARALGRGETVRGEQILVRHATEDRDVALLVSATPLRGPDGTVEGAVAVFRDVTAIRDLERERDALLAAAAHDLKNPLGAVKGAAQLLLRSLRRTGTVPPERLGPSLSMIEDTATRMAASLDELLDATRLRLGQPLALDRRPTDLVALARRLAAAYQAATEAHRIEVDAAAPTVVGEWDEARVGRVLGNILANALKYSPAGGEVRVEVGTEGRGWAVLRVRDQGVGVPAADLGRIFERFGRASNAAGVSGSGIGLAGARQIVEQHGGTIGVESTEGAGATFTVRLPSRPPGDAAAARTGGTT